MNGFHDFPLGAERLNNLTVSAIRIILDKARAMSDSDQQVIPLIAGEPDFATPEDMKQVAIRAIENNFTH